MSHSLHTALTVAADRFFEFVSQGIDSQTLTFVFPSRRACTFFRRHLAERSADKPIFAPHICTISDFILELSSLQQADRIGLLFELYQVYSEVCGGDAESFDCFVYWGELMLSDFNEIDKYLVDASDILTNSYDLNEMKRDLSYLSDEQRRTIADFWREFEQRALRNQQDAEIDQENIAHNFLSFYKHLAPVYKALHLLLRTKGVGYEGMIYREVAEQESYELSDEARYIFVGFFALSPAEQKILHKMTKRIDRTSFIWDYSGVPRLATGVDTESEIYQILRTHHERFGGEIVGQSFDARPMIDVIRSGGGIAQTQAVRAVMMERMAETSHLSPIERAIIPADETLLMPLLSTLPYNGAVNITMGYPIQQTVVAAAFDRWMELQLSIFPSQRHTNGVARYSADKVVELLSLQIFIETDPSLSSLAHRIRQGHTFFLSAEDILSQVSGDDSSLLRLLFAPLDFSSHPNLSVCLLERMLQILDTITGRLYSNALQKEEEALSNAPSSFSANLSPDSSANPSAPTITDFLPTDFTIEYLMAYRTIIERLRSLFVDNHYMIDPTTTAYLLRSLIRSTTVPLEGEPLVGLQIMGMLETRVISFDDVIILSAGEGILPKNKIMSTLIPFTIRRGYGLPTGEIDEYTMAYHFYHLANNAQHLTMIHDTRSEGIGGTGEESRYIKQMHYLYKYDMRIRTLNIDADLPAIPEIVIPKSAEVLESLATYFSAQLSDPDTESRALSPSLINVYVSCPLRFYYTAIKNLHQRNDLTELVEANEFGDLLHRIMQLIYDHSTTTYTGGIRTIDRPWYDHWLLPSRHLTLTTDNLIERECRTYFHLNPSEPFDMQAELTITELKRYVSNLLQYDRELTPFDYIGSELSYQGQIAIQPKGAGWSSLLAQPTAQIHIKGTIDRIDLLDGQLRVVDYKTGRIALSDNSPLLRPISFGSLLDAHSYPSLYNGAPHKEAFQTLFYAELLKQQELPALSGYPIVPTVYALRSIAKWQEGYTGRFWFKSDLPEGQKGGKCELYAYEQSIQGFPLSELFVDQLTACIDEIFDADHPFVQAPLGTRTCLYCPFATICGRSKHNT